MNSVLVFTQNSPNLFSRLYSENNTKILLIQTSNLQNNKINSKVSLLEIGVHCLVHKTRHVTVV